MSENKPICPTHLTELFSDGSCTTEDCQYMNDEVHTRFLEELDELEDMELDNGEDSDFFDDYNDNDSEELYEDEDEVD